MSTLSTASCCGAGAAKRGGSPTIRRRQPLPQLPSPTDMSNAHTMEQAQTLATLELPTERVIVPVKRRLRLRDLIREAAVIRVLAARDFKVKYKQSALGPAWLVFQPMALLLAFFVAFRNLTNIESSGVPYLLFTLVGLTVWSFFQAAMTIGAASIITNVAFVRYTPCPRPAF